MSIGCPKRRSFEWQSALQLGRCQPVFIKIRIGDEPDHESQEADVIEQFYGAVQFDYLGLGISSKSGVYQQWS